MKWIVRADCRPPNESTQPGKTRIEPRRHRQAHQHDQRQQHEDDDEIGELLQHVVALRGLAGRMPEAQVVADRARRCRAARRASARDRARRCRLHERVERRTRGR